MRCTSILNSSLHKIVHLTSVFFRSCRRGNEEDPWLSVEEHPSNVVYGEGSFNIPQWCPANSCPASCFTGNALDANYQCPNTCSHCNECALFQSSRQLTTIVCSIQLNLTAFFINKTAAPLSVVCCCSDAIMGHGGANVWVREVGGGGHRRAQSQNQFHLPTIDHCAASHLPDRLSIVNTVCCPPGMACDDGLPAACSIECAMEYAKFYSDCYGASPNRLLRSACPDCATLLATPWDSPR